MKMKSYVSVLLFSLLATITSCSKDSYTAPEITVAASSTFVMDANASVIIPFTSNPADADLSALTIRCYDATASGAITPGMMYGLKVASVGTSSASGAYMANVVIVDANGTRFTPEQGKKYRFTFAESFFYINGSKSDEFVVTFSQN